MCWAVESINFRDLIKARRMLRFLTTETLKYSPCLYAEADVLCALVRWTMLKKPGPGEGSSKPLNTRCDNIKGPMCEALWWFKVLRPKAGETENLKCQGRQRTRAQV